jgi:hypothetical protein
MTRAVLPVTVKQNRNGTWRVQRAGGRVIADNLSRSEAWRLWDENDRRISRIEDARKRNAYASGRW